MRNGMPLLALYLVGAWAEPRIVSVPDLHGDYERAVKVLQAAGLIDAAGSWIGGTATLVQTGDIADRGGDSLKIYRLFDRLAKEAQDSGGRVVNLLGNHELMNMQGDDRYLSSHDLKAYGGHSSWEQTWQPDGEIGKQVRNFKTAVLVGNLLFVHAGLLPNFVSGGRTLEDLNSDMISALSSSNLRGNSNLLGDSGPLWTRYFAESENAEHCKTLSDTLKSVGAVRMIVGHTIQQQAHGEFRARLACSGALILGDTAISSAYGGAMSFIEHQADGSAVVNYPGLNGLTETFPPSPVSLSEQDPHAEVSYEKAQEKVSFKKLAITAQPADGKVRPTSKAHSAPTIAGRFGVFLISALVLSSLALCVWNFRSPLLHAQKLRSSIPHGA